MQRPKQKVVVPKGTIDDSKTAIIEIPVEYKDLPVVVVVPKSSSSMKPSLKSGAQQNSWRGADQDPSGGCFNTSCPAKAMQPLAHSTPIPRRSECSNERCLAKVHTKTPALFEPDASKSKPPAAPKSNLQGPPGCSNTTCPSKTGSIRSSVSKTPSSAVPDQVEETKNESSAEESPPPAADDAVEEVPQPVNEAVEPTDKTDELPQPDSANEEVQKPEDDAPDASVSKERKGSKSSKNSVDLNKPDSDKQNGSIGSGGSNSSNPRKKSSDGDSLKHKCCKCPTQQKTNFEDEPEKDSVDEANDENDEDGENDEEDYNVLEVSPPDEANDDLEYYDAEPNQPDKTQTGGYKCGCAGPEASKEVPQADTGYGYNYYGPDLRQPSPVSNSINRTTLGSMPPNRYYNANQLGKTPPYEMSRSYAIGSDPTRSRQSPNQSPTPLKRIVTTVTETTSNSNLDGSAHPVYKQISKTTTITQVPVNENMRAGQPDSGLGYRTTYTPSSRPNYSSNNASYKNAAYSGASRYGQRYASSNVDSQAGCLQQPPANISRPGAMVCYPPSYSYNKNVPAPYHGSSNTQRELPSKGHNSRGHSPSARSQSPESSNVCKCPHHKHHRASHDNEASHSRRPSRNVQHELLEDSMKAYEDARRRLVTNVAKIGQLQV